MSIIFNKIEGFDNVWVTSDIHAFHKNISGKSVSSWESGYRDFNDEIEMTETIIQTFNKYVGKNDLLIHNGDLAFGGKENIEKFLEQLNCKNIIGIIGNHDHNILKYKNEFLDKRLFLNIEHTLYLNINGVDIQFNHFPLSIWHKQHQGSYHLFGHVHGAEIPYKAPKSMDIGIDVSYKLYDEYKPFNITEVIDLLKD